LNSVEVLHTFPESGPSLGNISVCEILQELSVSPTNSIWFNTKDLPEHLGPLVDREAMTLRSTENFLRGNRVSRKPTYLCNIVSVEIPAPSEGILDEFSELVANSIPDDLFELDVFGDGGFHVLEKYLPTYSTMTVIRNMPRTFHLLGERFGALRSIMLGPLDSCEGIAQALGGDVGFRAIRCPGASRKLGILRIPGSVLKDPESARRAREWLIPEDYTRVRSQPAGS
jgi:hypothetical protein